MSRVLLTLLVVLAGLPLAGAQDFPKFPQQAHVATGAEVKAYWIRTLRWQCRATRNRSLIETKQGLIKAIEWGLYDEEAEVAALRSNVPFFEFHERPVAAMKSREKINALQQSILSRRLAANPLPVAAGPAPVVARVGNNDEVWENGVQDPDVVYIEVDSASDCPTPVTSHQRRPITIPRGPRQPIAPNCPTPPRSGLLARPAMNPPSAPHNSRPQRPQPTTHVTRPRPPANLQPTRPSPTPRPSYCPPSSPPASQPAPPPKAPVQRPTFVPGFERGR